LPGFFIAWAIDRPKITRISKLCKYNALRRIVLTCKPEINSVHGKHTGIDIE